MVLSTMADGFGQLIEERLCRGIESDSKRRQFPDSLDLPFKTPRAAR